MLLSFKYCKCAKRQAARHKDQNQIIKKTVTKIDIGAIHREQKRN